MNSTSFMNTPRKPSFITRIRRNHGLEHATINVLTERYPGLHLGGYSTPFGFYIIGPVTREILVNAIDEAITRVTAGRRGLVIHERCGTNYVAGGILAGLAAWFGMLGAKRNTSSQLNRLPLVILLSTIALMFSPKMGSWLQRNITTTSQLQGLEIAGITSGKLGNYQCFTIHTMNY